jgi:hypothetical protein
MNDASNTASDDIQADEEEILNATVSDEAVEAVADTARGGRRYCPTPFYSNYSGC